MYWWPTPERTGPPPPVGGCHHQKNLGLTISKTKGGDKQIFFLGFLLLPNLNRRKHLWKETSGRWQSVAVGGSRWHSPCRAACSARESRRGMTMSWKHRLVSSVSLAFSAILWRLRHVSTTTSSEKPTPPAATRHNSITTQLNVSVWVSVSVTSMTQIVWYYIF